MDESTQRKRIARWVRDNRRKVLTRKRRTHALVQLGLAALSAIQKGDIGRQDVLTHVPANKRNLTMQLLEDEMTPKEKKSSFSSEKDLPPSS